MDPLHAEGSRSGPARAAAVRARRRSPLPRDWCAHRRHDIHNRLCHLWPDAIAWDERHLSEGGRGSQVRGGSADVSALCLRRDSELGGPYAPRDMKTAPRCVWGLCSCACKQHAVPQVVPQELHDWAAHVLSSCVARRGQVASASKATSCHRESLHGGGGVGPGSGAGRV
jgi:hypothetical protein